MGIWASASAAITGTFDTVTRAATTVDRSVSMAADYIDNRAKKQQRVDLETVLNETARELLALQEELEGNKKLRSLRDKLAKEW